MARKGAMAKNPPLRGQARKNFRAAQREAVASGGPMPTQDKFRPQPQLQSQPQTQPQQQSYDQARQAALGAAQQAMQQQPAPDQGGQMPPDKMYRFPQPAGQAGATLGAVMGNVAGSRSQGSPVFNAFPGNNPANMNQNNYGMFDNRRPQVMPEQGLIQDAMFRSPGVPMQNIPGMAQEFGNGLGNFAQMPQPSANNGGKYRLSPGVYGTKEQAMQQWAMQPAVPGAVNAPGSMSQIDLSQAVPYEQRRR